MTSDKAMISDATVTGFATPAFESCLDAFRSNFEDGGELGAACAIYWRGQPVMEAWGGIARSPTAIPWQRHTLAPLFSVTKGVAALCVLMLVEKGLIDLDKPVSAYWPEFAAHGKERVSVREALAHRAGVPMLSGPVTFADLADSSAMAARLADEVPLFAPGSDHLYHAITIGWITGELVRRTTGQSIGGFIRDRISVPLGLDLWIGRPHHDAAEVALIEAPPELDVPPLDPESPSARAISLNGLFAPTLAGLARAMNDPVIQAAELAGANGLSNARSLARFYAAAIGSVDGTRLISERVVADACTPVSSGTMWGVPSPGPTWGSGIMLPFSYQPMLGPGSFGHDGAGGSIAFAHPPTGISFAYVRNRMGQPGVMDRPIYRVIATLVRSLDLDPAEYFPVEKPDAA